MRKVFFFNPRRRETSSTSSSTSLFSLNLDLHLPPPSLSKKKDISLYYTLTYAAGLAFNLAYLVLENALVGWIFLTVELALALAVIAAKLWLERGGKGRREVEAKQKCAELIEQEERREEIDDARKKEEEKAGKAAERTASAEARV